MPKVYNKHHKDAPPGAVYIGRGSKWGNECVIGVDGDRNDVCDSYEETKGRDKGFIAMVKAELKGQDLVCFCKPARCHGDFLLKVANED